MKKLIAACGMLSLVGGVQVAEAAVNTYDVVTTWYEPDTQPKNTIFTGTFTWDDASHTVTSLQGTLTESMTGTWPPGGSAPYYDQTLVPLTYQLASWYDGTLGGTFAAAFAKNTTSTFYGNTWTPQDGVNNGGIYAGWPTKYANTIQNSYALIFVPNSLGTANTASNPLTLTWDEATGTGSGGLASTAYADCAPGGMMGAVCMTATSAHVYGGVGTMSGVPLSQTITAAVPEPENYGMMMAGLGLVGFMARRRKAS